MYTYRLKLYTKQKKLYISQELLSEQSNFFNRYIFSMKKLENNDKTRTIPKT